MKVLREGSTLMFVNVPQVEAGRTITVELTNQTPELNATVNAFILPLLRSSADLYDQLRQVTAAIQQAIDDSSQVAEDAAADELMDDEASEAYRDIESSLCGILKQMYPDMSRMVNTLNLLATAQHLFSPAESDGDDGSEDG